MCLPRSRVFGAGFSGEMRVRFLKSPTGAYKLGYDAGDEWDGPEAKCLEMIETGFAELVPQPEKSEAQTKMEKAVKKNLQKG